MHSRTGIREWGWLDSKSERAEDGRPLGLWRQARGDVIKALHEIWSLKWAGYLRLLGDEYICDDDFYYWLLLYDALGVF